VQVLKETRQLCSSAVEPLVNSVDAVKQFGVDKVVKCLFFTVSRLKHLRCTFTGISFFSSMVQFFISGSMAHVSRCL